MELEGLKRKAPNARHFFAYKRNGRTYTGLKLDFIQALNTVVRPDIPVKRDAEELNNWLDENPDQAVPFDFREEMEKLNQKKLIGIVIGYTLFVINFIFNFIYLDSRDTSPVGFIFAIVIIFSIQGFEYFIKTKKAELRVVGLQEPEWIMNGRTYGEHPNEKGEYVLFPKRGDGFYSLSALEYLKLYTLQVNEGDLPKSESLFNELRKKLILEGTIEWHEKLPERQQNKVIGIYNEFSQTKVVEN